jgi:hypothetical protein
VDRDGSDPTTDEPPVPKACRTYSLAEAAAQICGDSMKDPVLWMRRKIRAGTFSAYKAGRSVRMTEQQVVDAINALQIEPRVEHATRRMGLTERSRRIRSRVKLLADEARFILNLSSNSGPE